MVFYKSSILLYKIFFNLAFASFSLMDPKVKVENNDIKHFKEKKTYNLSAIIIADDGSYAIKINDVWVKDSLDFEVVKVNFDRIVLKDSEGLKTIFLSFSCKNAL